MKACVALMWHALTDAVLRAEAVGGGVMIHPARQEAQEDSEAQSFVVPVPNGIQLEALHHDHRQHADVQEVRHHHKLAAVSSQCTCQCVAGMCADTAVHLPYIVIYQLQCRLNVLETPYVPSGHPCVRLHPSVAVCQLSKACVWCAAA